jgi:hypothetical protein
MDVKGDMFLSSKIKDVCIILTFYLSFIDIDVLKNNVHFPNWSFEPIVTPNVVDYSSNLRLPRPREYHFTSVNQCSLTMPRISYPLDKNLKCSACHHLPSHAPFRASHSGSSWLDGVNGILMQQEPNLPKQDYWNRRAIASLANTLFTVVAGASSNAFTVFYAAATALEMPV